MAAFTSRTRPKVKLGLALRAHVEPIDLCIVVEHGVELRQVELARIALGEGLRACRRKRRGAVDICLVSETARPRVESGIDVVGGKRGLGHDGHGISPLGLRLTEG